MSLSRAAVIEENLIKLGRAGASLWNEKILENGGKMKIWLFIGIVSMVLITGACSAPMFLVNKAGDERRGHFLGKKSDIMYEMLCVSGGLLKVLETTHLSKTLKDEFYQSNCAADRSFAKVKKIYIAMTREQRKDIRTAFKKNGYSINSGAC